MKRTIFLGLFASMVLVGCTGKQSEVDVNSKVKASESTNVTTSESEPEDKTVASIDSNEPNYTLQVIRTMAETTEDLDTLFPDLYDRPDDHKILAEPSYAEGSYSFIGGPDNGEPAISTENEEDSEKYNLSKNPEAASIKEVKQLIEELKQERIQNQ